MVVWIGGDMAQRRSLADAMLRGAVVPCLAYSEAEHGADLLANDVEAVPDVDSYLLRGRKWPINRAATSTHAVLLARTNTRRVGLNQSLFLVAKNEVAEESFTELARVPTYGLRGCDISGIAFEGTRVRASALIGTEGRGLELALRGLMLTRTLCAGLSLGVADTMLRVVGDHLGSRRLYGALASDIPQIRETLANTYLSLLVAECASIAAMRGLHLYPDEFSTWSSIAKVQVTRLIDHGAQALARILGARSYLRSEEDRGIFQKMLRDGNVVSTFDGSEAVCLDSLAIQLGAMADACRNHRVEDWAALYDLRVPLGDFRPERITVASRGKDAVLASLPSLRRRLELLAPGPECAADRLTTLRSLAAGLQRRVDTLFDDVRAAMDTAEPTTLWTAKSTPTRLVRLAILCCAVHVDITCLGIWLYNRDHLGSFFAGGAWLEAALARNSDHNFDVGDLAPPLGEILFRQMTRQREDHRFFSILSVSQANRQSRQ